MARTGTPIGAKGNECSVPTLEKSCHRERGTRRQASSSRMFSVTQEEIEALDRQLAEDFTHNAIALTQRLYEKPEKQACELRYWYEVVNAFPCHLRYSKQLLATEINRLEQG